MFIAHAPIVARLVKRILPSGKSLAAQADNPALVIFFSVLEMTFPFSLVISVGTAQRMSPFQYSFLFVEGVLPPTTSQMSPILTTSQSIGISPIFVFLNFLCPMSRVSNSCIKPFFNSFVFSIISLLFSIASSTLVKISAIFFCSGRGGYAIRNSFLKTSIGTLWRPVVPIILAIA
ncbi:hypothetical protein ES703_93571 [subsurface metagenome]